MALSIACRGVAVRHTCVDLLREQSLYSTPQLPSQQVNLPSEARNCPQGWKVNVEIGFWESLVPGSLMIAKLTATLRRTFNELTG